MDANIAIKIGYEFCIHAWLQGSRPVFPRMKETKCEFDKPNS